MYPTSKETENIMNNVVYYILFVLIVLIIGNCYYFLYKMMVIKKQNDGIQQFLYSVRREESTKNIGSL